MSDLINRQDAIDILKHLPNDNPSYWNKCDVVDRQDAIDEIEILPPAQPEQTKMIKEIRKWINSRNRGSADYFIVDKIEEIINKYE